MVAYYSHHPATNVLDRALDWRRPQLGALAGVMAHWTRTAATASLVSLPTGTGKTAVGLAAPYLAEEPPEGVLVVVPSVVLREQLGREFRCQEALRRIGAIQHLENPAVLELAGRGTDWAAVAEHDVVVALPESISPRHHEDDLPPPDLFDLVIVDEAHHTPAATWQAILNHFDWRHALLLTATPTRRDRKEVPGETVYRYPLRRAIDDGSFHPITPHLLDAPNPFDRGAADLAIAERVVSLAQEGQHANSTVMIRGRTLARLQQLAALYESLGLPAKELHSRVPPAERQQILAGLMDGSIRAVVVDGMLGEGFDLPSLRITGYHDKHRSFEPTIQLIGRLARTSPDHPADSNLVTVRDHDVYPQLQGALRFLYDNEDHDWASLLPAVIDDHAEAEKETQEYVEAFPAAEARVDLPAVTPQMRVVGFQTPDPDWRPWFVTDEIPDELNLWTPFAGGTVVYRGAHQTSRLFVVVTEHREMPRWSTDAEMASREFKLHVLAYRQPAGDHPAFVFVNTDDGYVMRALRDLLAMPEGTRLIDHQRLHHYLDHLPRLSVSNVGMRTTGLAGRGTTSYRHLMGSGVEQGLRRSDVASAALGHVMLQYQEDGRSASGGAALEKAKIWVQRYVPLLAYDRWLDEITAGLRNGEVGPGRLLPEVDRGRSLREWPHNRVLAAEHHPMLLGQAWVVDGQFPIEDLLLTPVPDREVPEPGGVLQLALVGFDGEEDVGELRLTPDGGLVETAGLMVRCGHVERALADLLIDYPPTVFFLDGTTVTGSTVYPPSGMPRPFEPQRLIVHDWPNTKITTEPRDRMADDDDRVSVHEAFEVWADADPSQWTHRWILCNDGSGEIADHLVIEEESSGVVRLGLWHSKPSAEADPGLRIGDLQVVAAQAARSRWHFRSRGLWESLRRRMNGEENPTAVLIHGERQLLDDRLDPEQGAWATQRPQVVPTIGIVQPGLSKQRLLDERNNGGADAFVQLMAVVETAAESVDGDFMMLVSA